MSAEIFPTPLDWVALAVLLVSLLAGFMRGFLIEAIALCGWVGGFFLARAFAADVAAWLPMENSLPGVRLAAGFALTVALAYLLESRAGSVHPQDWEFYAVTVCLFLVAAFPGFVWRYFWQERDKQ